MTEVDLHEVDQEIDDDPVHITCCNSDDRALCGLDVPDAELVEDYDDEEECETCARIYKTIMSIEGPDCPGCIWSLDA